MLGGRKERRNQSGVLVRPDLHGGTLKPLFFFVPGIRALGLDLTRLRFCDRLLLLKDFDEEVGGTENGR